LGWQHNGCGALKMIQRIQTDLKKLQIKCVDCTLKTKEDKELNKTIITDMIDTVQHSKIECIGLAANQIGYDKRIIILIVQKQWMPLLNPKPLYLNSTGMKTDWEKCLSWYEIGDYRVRRYKAIKVKYINAAGNNNQITFRGLAARVIQHEIDHLNGIIPDVVLKSERKKQYGT